MTYPGRLCSCLELKLMPSFLVSRTAFTSVYLIYSVISIYSLILKHLEHISFLLTLSVLHEICTIDADIFPSVFKMKHENFSSSLFDKNALSLGVVNIKFSSISINQKRNIYVLWGLSFKNQGVLHGENVNWPQAVWVWLYSFSNGYCSFRF